MPRIIAVLEHLLNDTDALFLIDVEATDSTDREQVAYRDAIEASIAYEAANHEKLTGMSTTRPR